MCMGNCQGGLDFNNLGPLELNLGGGGGSFSSCLPPTFNQGDGQYNLHSSMSGASKFNSLESGERQGGKERLAGALDRARVRV